MYLYLIILIIIATILLIIIDEKNKYVQQDNIMIVNTKGYLQKCYQVCNKKVCDSYQNKLTNYYNCLYCKNQNKCFSKDKNKCVNCTNFDYNIQCSSKDRFGCENPKGILYEDVPPIDPMNNKCKMC
jgi:hypothetical protein